MGRTVITRKPCPVHAEGNVQILQGDIMDDHVKGSLHEGRVDGEERLHATSGHPRGKKRGMLLGDPHIVEAIRVPLCKLNEPGAVRHRGRDRHDLAVVIGKIGQGFPKDLGIGRRVGCGCLTGVGLVFSEAVEFVGLRDGRTVALSFFCQDMKDHRFVQRF